MHLGEPEVSWIFDIGNWTFECPMSNIEYPANFKFIAFAVRYLTRKTSLLTRSLYNCLIIVTSSTIDCDIISRTKTEAQGRGVKLAVFIVIDRFVMSCKKSNNVCILVTNVFALRALFLYLFPSLLRNSGNKHKNNPLVSAETVRHSSMYNIPYLLHGFMLPLFYVSFRKVYFHPINARSRHDWLHFQLCIWHLYSDIFGICG